MAVSSFPYFQKDNDCLDYLGIMVSATSGSQTVWAPGYDTSGNGGQEFPGGWVTPGNYDITINTSGLHDFDGIRSGNTRGGHEIGAVHVSALKGIDTISWSHHGHSDPDSDDPYPAGPSAQSFVPVLKGTGTYTVELSAGDTLHLAYTNNQYNSGRAGSDGFEVYCVDSAPAPRGGSWGCGSGTYNSDKWDLFVERCKWIASGAQAYKSISDYDYGVESLPDPFPSDYHAQASDGDHEQRSVASRHIWNRGLRYADTGDPGRGNLAELHRYIEWALNQGGYTWYWSMDCDENYHAAQGESFYKPYARDNMISIIIGAACAGYTPDYEPLRRAISFFAQTVNTAQYHFGDEKYDSGINVNEGNGFGISAIYNSSEQDSHIRWLYDDLGRTEYGSRGGGRQLATWGFSVWCRELLEYTPSVYWPENMYYDMGWDGNTTASAWEHEAHSEFDAADRRGHGGYEDGSYGMYSTFYAGIDMEGIMWLHFTDTSAQSEVVRWRSRNLFWGGVDSSGGTNDPDDELGDVGFVQFCHATYVTEVSGVSAIGNDTAAELSWAAHEGTPDLSGYEIWRGAETSTMSLVGVAASDTTNYLDNDGTSGLLYSVRAMTTSSFPDMYAGSFLSEPQAASGGTPAGGGTPVIPHVRMRHVDIQY